MLSKLFPDDKRFMPFVERAFAFAFAFAAKRTMLAHNKGKVV
jgi:hypothetical protein